MGRVYLLQHLHLPDGNEEDVKTVGIYSTRDAALAAIDRLRVLPGFRDCPQLADTAAPRPAEGFCIDEYELDQDGWSAGYDTL